MLGAARTHHDSQIAPTVCGASNVGNYLAAHQIAATCGFAVTYEHLHAPNERIKLDTIQNDPPGDASAIRSLLAPTATLHGA